MHFQKPSSRVGNVSQRLRDDWCDWRATKGTHQSVGLAPCSLKRGLTVLSLRQVQGPPQGTVAARPIPLITGGTAPVTANSLLMVKVMPSKLLPGKTLQEKAQQLGTGPRPQGGAPEGAPPEGPPASNNNNVYLCFV